MSYFKYILLIWNPYSKEKKSWKKAHGFHRNIKQHNGYDNKHIQIITELPFVMLKTRVMAAENSALASQEHITF